jgi:hypothetical protein
MNQKGPSTPGLKHWIMLPRTLNLVLAAHNLKYNEVSISVSLRGSEFEYYTGENLKWRKCNTKIYLGPLKLNIT